MMTRRELLRLMAAAPLAASVACRKTPVTPATATQASATGPVFRDVTSHARLSFVHSIGPRTHLLPEDMGSGIAWGDYDNDGYPDLYVVNQTGPWAGKMDGPGDRLFHNNGDGTFTDVTESTGLEYMHCGMGAFWGDYDNDGLLDLLVTGADGACLYHNEGSGRFRDVTRSSGAYDPLWSTGAVWMDFDSDGWLDLYIVHYVEYPRDPAQVRFAVEEQYGVVVPSALNPRSFAPQPNRLLRNNRDGTFSDVTARAGVADAQGRSLAVTAADFALNGSPDLYVGNDLSMNRFFLNERGRFADRSTQTFTSENKGSMGLAVIDFDFDGALDFYVSHWLSLGDSLYQNMLAATKKLNFADAAELTNLAYVSLPMAGWGCAFMDYDNDSFPDLVVVNGSTLENAEHLDLLVPQKPFLFHYDGNTFTNVVASVAPEMDRPLNARGLAAADFDNDGDVDFAVSCNRGRLMLMRADGAEHANWLKIALQGTKSNRQGIGALVKVTADGKQQMQSYGSQGSYLSQHATTLHFGLGHSSRTERVEIAWPSGRKQVVENVAARQTLHLREE